MADFFGSLSSAFSSTVKSITSVPTTLISQAGETARSLGGNVQGIFSSLSMPLMIGGGAVLLIMLTKK